MSLKWFFLSLASMVHTRTTNKLKRAKKVQKRGEYISICDSESDKESIDWDELCEEDSDHTELTEPTKKVSSASELKTTSSTAGKELRSMPQSSLSMKRKTLARRKGRARGIETEKSTTPDSPSPLEHICVNTNRMKAFEDRECIGERHVDIAALCIRSPEFGILIEQANLLQVCKFGETNGYCLHLIRTFYANAQQLREFEGGPMEFYTLVRGTSMKITPQLVGQALGMKASVTGTNFLKGTSLTETSLQKVIDGICLPNTQITGFSVHSKDLRLEYRFLNFMVCYNVLPNMQTKILRWDRMIFLYLLGHPLKAAGLNVNIPYVIWSRMARFVDHSCNPERLPFPLIIMRILWNLGVDTSSTSYQHCSGKIDESTVVKSLETRMFDTLSPQSGRTPTASTSAFQAQTPAGTSSQQVPPSEDEASIASLCKDQKKMFLEQERIVKTQDRIFQEIEIITAAQVMIIKKCKHIQKTLKKLSEKNSCDWSKSQIQTRCLF